MGEGGRRGGQSDEVWARLNLPLLVLQMEEGAPSQGVCADSGSKKREGNGFSREEHHPDNSLILAQRDPCQTSDLQHCKVMNLYLFKALNLWQCVIAAIENKPTSHPNSLYSAESSPVLGSLAIVHDITCPVLHMVICPVLQDRWGHLLLLDCPRLSPLPMLETPPWEGHYVLHFYRASRLTNHLQWLVKLGRNDIHMSANWKVNVNLK